ncbi:MAG TPA: SRPBCC family protein [Thermomicrobiales bacterium]|nr:SRPBCC family protein [Thermomicrobiales bacterium]
MHTENSVVIRGPLDRVVALAADVEAWPRFLPHYRWVTLLEGGGDRKLVEMAARRGWWPVRWRALQTIDRSTSPPTIRYRHVWGPTRGMEVGWEFRPEPAGIVVRIWHELDLQWSLVGSTPLGRAIAAGVIGPGFVGPIASQTLATIKAIVERERGAEAGG